MRRSPHNVPLIVEPHTQDYSGYNFITLIRYNDTDTLNVVDNIIGKNIHTYVLDFCGPEEVNEQEFVNIAFNWYYSESFKRYPLSVEFSRVGYSHVANKILRVFPMDYITRIIGPVNEYPMSGYTKCRKRKKRSA